MTSKEKEALKVWNIQITEGIEKANQCLRDLQDLSRKYNMHAWCSVNSCMQQLQNDDLVNKHDQDKAAHLAMKYFQYMAKNDALRDLLIALN